MSKIKDKAAREKVVAARTNLLVSNGFFGFLALQLRLEEATDVGGHEIPTMGVDGVTIFYNPTFVHSLNEREIEAVEAHEVMHCCFKHFSRRGDRDPKLWNMAGDYVINNDLTASVFTLPWKPCTFDMLVNSRGQLPKGEKFHLADPALDGMTTEEIYDKLYQKATKIQIQMGDGGDPGGCGEVLDAPGGAAGQEAAKQTWETAVRQAVAVAAANNAGSIPGSLKRLIDDLSKPKVSWKDLTRAFINQSLIKDISWSRISRRSTALGTLLPGLISDRPTHLVFVVDTSGSVDAKLLNEFMSEVAGALDQGTADQLSVLYADTRVHDVDEFVPGDLVTARELSNGGGGTDFEDCFKWIKEKIPDASCVIYLTDLQVYNFGEDPGCPTLWAVFGPSSYYPQLADKVPFGTPIHVSGVYE